MIAAHRGVRPRRLRRASPARACVCVSFRPVGPLSTSAPHVSSRPDGADSRTRHRIPRAASRRGLLLTVSRRRFPSREGDLLWRIFFREHRSAARRGGSRSRRALTHGRPRSRDRRRDQRGHDVEIVVSRRGAFSFPNKTQTDARGTTTAGGAASRISCRAQRAADSCTFVRATAARRVRRPRLATRHRRGTRGGAREHGFSM